MSVTIAPLDRIKENAACPGVSKNVMFRFLFLSLTLKAPMCWVIPPNSLSTMWLSRRESSKVVLPWSTWPIMVTTGGLVTRLEGDGLSRLAIPSSLESIGFKGSRHLVSKARQLNYFYDRFQVGYDIGVSIGFNVQSNTCCVERSIESASSRMVIWGLIKIGFSWDFLEYFLIADRACFSLAVKHCTELSSVLKFFCILKNSQFELLFIILKNKVTIIRQNISSNE
ncbi:hypothetical protein BpHYR1_036322 [Brachionus plicatilis]|uniref:Uncharacterized protein n=1 Tax=Brachionus plicatilis TaxID=10195 RepID=A0A3M7PWV4_BRAPC|nr:hypothetical protein BpHYR1_036322 [Brachionus plicatilis]